MKGLLVVLSLLIGTLPLVSFPATAEQCEGGGGTVGGELEVFIECQHGGGRTPNVPSTVGGRSPFVAYRWASMCTRDPLVVPTSLECTASLTCSAPKLRRWQLWGQLENGSWRVIRTQCFGGRPPAYEPPTVTPAMVLSALRRVGLPELATHVQPRGKTLVNFDTIFWTDPRPVNVELTILRQGVEVEARPTRFEWYFGDGSAATTQTPGEPYPSKEIVHRYLDAAVTVHPHVDAVYAARFRVSGGAWQEIAETVTTTGPDGELRVVEGTPLLTSTGS